MKVLVLAQEIGGNAPGILYERLLSAMSSLCQLDIATCSYRPSVPDRPGLSDEVSAHETLGKTVAVLLDRQGLDFLSSGPSAAEPARRGV